MFTPAAYDVRTTMAEPIVFISRSRVREGQLDALRALLQATAPSLATEKPRTLTLLAYVDDAARILTIVHVFADAESMDLHMVGVVERSRTAEAYIETLGFEVYGRPREAVLAMLGQGVDSGVTLRHDPDFVGGFLHLGRA
jgi:hypothetical protein